MEKKESLYETKLYEIICNQCSKPFMSKDANDCMCPECWEKFLGNVALYEGEGK